ncbi:MAG: L-rhamnose/proton symporter RhaT [Terriglobia bacterium]
MPSTQWIGLWGVLAGGVFQGSFMLPMKWTKHWTWENTWLIFACWAYLLCPWIIVFASIQHPFRVYAATNTATLLTMGLFGILWGVSAVTFGLGVTAVGMSLGFAIIAGLAAFAGTVIPLILLPSHGFSALRIIVTSASLILMLAGVAVCSFAGKWKEQIPEPGTILSYRKGLWVCVISGILSSCGNLGFVSSSEVVRKAQSLGVSSYLAPNLVWAFLCLYMFIFNAGYSILLLRRNRSASNFRKDGTRRYFLFGALMGILWMGGFFFYGAGARQLGELGPSLGWGIFMSTIVLAANLLGMATGEWRNAPTSAKARLAQGLVLLLLAIAGLGFSNSLR